MYYLYEFDDNLGHYCLVEKVNNRAQIIQGAGLYSHNTNRYYSWCDAFVITKVEETDLATLQEKYPEYFV